MKKPTITRTSFRTWLLAQPGQRKFCYTDNDKCLIASFIKETGVCTNPHVGGSTWRRGIDNHRSIAFPLWLLEASRVFLSLCQAGGSAMLKASVSKMRKAYLK